MIVDDVQKIEAYIDCISSLDIIEIIRTYKDKPKGDYALSDVLTVKSVHSTTKAEDVAKIEAHHHHIDIQIPIDKEELYYIYSWEDVREQTDYDPNKDVIFFTTPNKKRSSVYVKPGQFILLSPNEIHQPQITLTDSESITKIVLKVNC